MFCGFKILYLIYVLLKKTFCFRDSHNKRHDIIFPP